MQTVVRGVDFNTLKPGDMVEDTINRRRFKVLNCRRDDILSRMVGLPCFILKGTATDVKVSEPQAARREKAIRLGLSAEDEGVFNYIFATDDNGNAETFIRVEP